MRILKGDAIKFLAACLFVLFFCGSVWMLTTGIFVPALELAFNESSETVTQSDGLEAWCYEMPEGWKPVSVSANMSSILVYFHDAETDRLFSVSLDDFRKCGKFDLPVKEGI